MKIKISQGSKSLLKTCQLFSSSDMIKTAMQKYLLSAIFRLTISVQRVQFIHTNKQRLLTATIKFYGFF